MLPNLFILNNSGDVIIEKHFLGQTKRVVCELFWEEVQKYESQNQVPPIITTENYYLVNVRKSSLFYLTAINSETSPLLLFEIIHRIIDIFKYYFNDKVTDQTIRENFALIYQLLDEIVIGGFPLTTEINQLMDLISTPTLSGKLRDVMSGNFTVKDALPSAFNNPKTPWRKPDVKYVSNEIKIDIIESIDAIIQHSNVRDQAIVSNINGELEVNSHLSGDPDLLLSFSNPRLLEHMQLHRCVRISKWQKEKAISFVPPDGLFTLLKYHVPNAGVMPINVHPVITLNSRHGNVKVTVSRITNAQDKQIDKLLIEIPFPSETHSFILTSSVGKVTQDEITKIVRWNIGKFPKDNKEPVLEGTVSLPTDYEGTAKPTIKVGFEIKGLSMTNLRIDSLGVHNVKYKPFKGVRHITRAGQFLVRS